MGVRVCGSEFTDRLAFECEDGPFWVTLLAVAPEKPSGKQSRSPEITRHELGSALY